VGRERSALVERNESSVTTTANGSAPRNGSLSSHPLTQDPSGHQLTILDLRYPWVGPSSISRRVTASTEVFRAEILDDRLAAGYSAVLVQAPAGWGKSTLVHQWEITRPIDVVRLSIRQGDQDPVVLIGRLLQALDGEAAPVARLLAGPITDPAFFEAVTIPRLVEHWNSRTSPVTVVVDDAHRLDGSAGWQVIGALLEHTGADRVVVVCGRTLCPLPVAHLIADKRLTRIGPYDLAMDVDHAVELLSQRGACIGRENAAILVRRTGGWPVALSLAAPSLANAESVTRVTEAFSVSDPDASLYFREAVLAGLPKDLYAFLKCTASLPVLHADICNAMASVDNSSLLLSELARRLLIRPSLTRPGEYTHHPMLRPMLEAEFHCEDPQSERLAHRRAAMWLSGIGDTEASIVHARASGDLELAATLVWRAAGGMLFQGGRRTVERWLASFDGRVLLASPGLALTMAWCSLEAGRHIQPWLSAADRGLRSIGAAADPSMLCGLSLLASATAVGGLPGMLARAQEVHRDAAADDPWRSMACYLIGSAHHLHDDNQEAERWLVEGEQLSRLLSAPAVSALCLARQGLLALDEGDWDRMASLADRALDVVRQNGLAEVATMVPVFVVSALAMAHQNKRTEAEATALHAARLLSYLELRLPWLTYEAKVILGKAHLLLGDSVAARNMLAEAQTVDTRTFQSRRLKRLLDEEWSMASASPLSTTLGPSALTTAELRVLQLLQTHLSFQEIGNMLFVSRNTVKTQAIAAYRKLGVNSRSEAVDTARRLGLMTSVSSGSIDS
jgi:LuxR family maltose regulon positive regulatory protein